MNGIFKVALLCCVAGSTCLICGCGHPPKIVSPPPPKETFVGLEYKYCLCARGEEPITFRKVEAPTGMDVTREGLVRWTPATEGEFGVTIKATNERGTAFDSFRVRVVAPPAITSKPSDQGTPGHPYSYEAKAKGTEPVRFAVVMAPEGFRISQNGSVEWTPPLEGGDFSIIIQAENKVGMDIQQFALHVPVKEKTRQYSDGFQWGLRLWSAAAEDQHASLLLVEYLRESAGWPTDTEFRQGLIDGFQEGAAKRGKPAGLKAATEAADTALEAGQAKSDYQVGRLVGEGVRKNTVQVEEAGRQKRRAELSGRAKELAWKAGFVRGYAGEEGSMDNAARLYYALP